MHKLKKENMITSRNLYLSAFENIIVNEICFSLVKSMPRFRTVDSLFKKCRKVRGGCPQGLSVQLLDFIMDGLFYKDYPAQKCTEITKVKGKNCQSENKRLFSMMKSSRYPKSQQRKEVD